MITVVVDYLRQFWLMVEFKRIGHVAVAVDELINKRSGVVVVYNVSFPTDAHSSRCMTSFGL